MLNARTMRKWLFDSIKGDKDAICRQHIVACSSALQKTGEFGIDPANVFGFWDWVGGRFSIHSAVGMVPLALHYGFGTMRKFLDGARAMDEHFLSAPLESNLPVMLGLFGLWNSSFLGHAARAVLPYSQVQEKQIPTPCLFTAVLLVDSCVVVSVDVTWTVVSALHPPFLSLD